MRKNNAGRLKEKEIRFYTLGSTFDSIAEKLGDLATSYWAYSLLKSEPGSSLLEKSFTNLKDAVSELQKILGEMEERLLENSLGSLREVEVSAGGFLLLRRATAELCNNLNEGKEIRSDLVSVFNEMERCFPGKESKDVHPVSARSVEGLIPGAYSIILDEGFVARFVEEQRILHSLLKSEILSSRSRRKAENAKRLVGSFSEKDGFELAS